jgi:hypothetical protein
MQQSKNFLSSTATNNMIHSEIDMFKLTTDEMKTIEDKQNASNSKQIDHLLRSSRAMSIEAELSK